MESEIRENFDCGIWNPGFWLEESGIPWTIEFQNPSSTDCNPVSQESTGIQGVESRIHDCVGFLYMGRIVVCLPFYPTVSHKEQKKNCLMSGLMLMMTTMIFCWFYFMRKGLKKKHFCCFWCWCRLISFVLLCFCPRNRYFRNIFFFRARKLD